MKDIQELLELANAAHVQSHYAAAFEMYRTIIALDPGNDLAIYRAVKNLLGLERVTDAESYLSQIRRNAAPKPWLIEITLGEMCLARFKPSQAEEHFRNAWKLSRDSTAAAVFLADCLSRQEKFSEAYAVLIGALEVQGDHDEVYLNLGLVKRAVGDYLSAKQFLSKAIAITPDYPDARRVLEDVEACLKLMRERD